MLAKHTTVESANLFRHKRCICQNVLTTTTKKMKNHEIYLCEIRDPRFEKFQDYSIYLFLDRFLRARDKTCMHLDAFVLLFLEPFSSSNFGFKIFDCCLRFRAISRLDTDKRINDKLIKIKAKGIYQRFPFCISPIKCVRNIYER